MIIQRVEFAGAIGAPGGKAPPGALPQVALAGRSNVGKSSLINRLLGRTRTAVARVSSTPGKTREINFFRVTAKGGGGRKLEFFLVDLPGYGYARVPADVRDRWKALIEGYLGKSDALRGVVQLIDARHGPSKEDLRMVEYLASLEKPTLFALTKVDKLGRAERAKQLAQVRKSLAVDADQVIPFSAQTGEGRDDLLGALEAVLVETGDAT